MFEAIAGLCTAWMAVAVVATLATGVAWVWDRMERK